MPEVSRFFGIVISMYYNDHDPPHFHARYGEHKAIVAIDSFDVIGGGLPSRVLGLGRVLIFADAQSSRKRARARARARRSSSRSASDETRSGTFTGTGTFTGQKRHPI